LEKTKKEIIKWEFFTGYLKKRKSNRVKIIDSDGLSYKDGVGRGYYRLKRTYNKQKLSNYINGKRVEIWEIVYWANDAV